MKYEYVRHRNANFPGKVDLITNIPYLKQYIKLQSLYNTPYYNMDLI